jgi:hypothetical protein
MAINELIARGSNPIQFESPVNRLAKMLQIQGAQQNIARGEMEQDQYLQGVERKNKLVQLMGGLPADATDDQRISALKGGTFFDEADKLGKVALERRKIGSEASAKDIETARKKLDIAGSAFNQVRQSPTLENANAVLDYLGANGVYTPDLVAQYKAQVAANPADIGRLADIAFRSAIDAKDQLAKNTSENLGGNMAYNSTDPLTGRVTQTGLVPITQTADNAATAKAAADRLQAEIAARAREAALGRGNAMEIAKMSDLRARELNENSREANRIAQDNKPLTEGQAKSALFGSRMQEANDILESLAKSGTNTSTPGMNSGYGVGSVVSALSSNDQQQLMQAKRNFVNAVLRRESGAVIADSEFANAERQYFPQIGDSKEVIAQKKANREAATRGVLIDVPESRRDRIVSEIRRPQAKQQAPASPQDMQALEWANANPNDPRAAKIKQRLGQ